MKRKWNALLLAVTMLASLAACGANPPAAGPAPVEPNTSASGTNQPEAPASASAGTRTLKLTLEGDEGTQEVTAALMDIPAAAEFARQMPFTVEMHDHLDRQKEVYLDFSLSEESQTNTVNEYEIGDIVYWHPGPTMGIFYDHDGRSISAGIEILAKLDEGGVEAIHSYADLVSVTFELAEDESAASAGRQLEITLSGDEGEPHHRRRYGGHRPDGPGRDRRAGLLRGGCGCDGGAGCGMIPSEGRGLDRSCPHQLPRSPRVRLPAGRGSTFTRRF